MGRQFIEVLKSVRVMQDDRERGVYIEAATAFKKPVTALCHFKEVQVSRSKEDRPSIGCKKKAWLFIKSRKLEDVVLEGELHIKPSHKKKHAQQCEMMKVRLVAGNMWYGIECPKEDCDKWSWRTQQLAENLKRDHEGDHKG